MNKMEKPRAFVLGDQNLAKMFLGERAQVVADMEVAPDILFMSTLQTLERTAVPEVLRAAHADLAEDGELWVVTPSLEWALEHIKDDVAGVAAFRFLYGTEATPYRCGFILNWLRTAVRGAGFAVRKASHYQVAVEVNGKRVPALYNVVIGGKVDYVEPMDMAAAAAGRGDVPVASTALQL